MMTPLPKSSESNPLEFTTLGNQDILLTPNRRLAAWWLRDYEQWMLQSGKKAWKSPRALPLDVWLEELFHQITLLNPALDFPQLLGQQQSRVVWQGVVEDLQQRYGGLDTMDTTGLVKLCQQARTLICRWCLVDDDWNHQDTLENRFFSDCHFAYRQQLQTLGWVDRDGIIGHLVESEGLHLPIRQGVRLFLHGFNDQDEPSLLRLRQWLDGMGVEVRFTQQRILDSAPVVTVFDEHPQQFRGALLWALERWQKQDNVRIGVVVPDLQNQRNQLQQVCEDLASANRELLGWEWQQHINITAGLPLAHYPQISHLLLLLQGLLGPTDLSHWQVVLKSPFLVNWNTGGTSRFEANDRLLTGLRKQQRTRYRIGELPGNLSDWLPGLTDDLLPRSGVKRSFAKWSGWLRDFTDAIGWGRARSFNSEEFQVNERWQGLLDSLIELDPFVPDVTFTGYLRELKTQAGDTVFQPQTETAPIQVMGLLEAAGLNFDKLWVCECESTQWPQSVNPNPFLPRRTLQLFNMPGSGAERELSYARQLLQGFQQSAPEVHFSWARFQGDLELSLTPLLDDLDCAAENELAAQAGGELASHTRTESQRTLSAMIKTEKADEQGSPLQPGAAKGGSALIQSQSICPFKSYARFRLGIAEQDELEEGVRASDRGSLIHKVLERFWSDINNFDELVGLLAIEDKFDSYLTTLICEEMEQFRKDVFLAPEALYDLEQKRTFTVIRDWLTQQEIRRKPFAIDRIERRHQFDLAGLQLNLMADRIDTLADGSKVVIDYKTGLVNVKSWQGERPEQPQLPLYLLLDKEKTRGLYFAMVRPDQADWKGLDDGEIEFIEYSKRRKTSEPELTWDEQVTHWENVLTTLAKEYLEGVATVTPIDDKACQYCHLSSVCRVRELQHADN